MPELSIRPLEADQIETLGRLARETWHQHYPGIISRAQIEFMLDQRYKPSDIQVSLDSQHWDAAWLGSEMVGFAHSHPDGASGAWKLDKLYVHPAHQRKGIGRALLEAVIAHATKSGSTRLILRVNKHNTVALAAYAKYGFRIYAEHALDIGNGFVMDDYLLEKDLCS